jgi:hypothetical protein
VAGMMALFGDADCFTLLLYGSMEGKEKIGQLFSIQTSAN